MQKIANWCTIGMSKFSTPGFQDTSRFMTVAFHGKTAYVEPPKPFSAWRHLDGTVIAWSSRHEHEVTVLTPPLPIPGKIDPLRIGTRLQANRLDQKLCREFGSDWRDSTLVYCTNWSYYQQPLLAALKPRYLVFDIVDDVLSFPYPLQRDRVLAAWRWMAKHASLVTAVSAPLVELCLAQTGQQAMLLPNGVEAERFLHVEGELPPELPPRSPEEFRIGFAGTLNHWIDFEGICRVIDSDPRCRLFLMGRIGQFSSPAQSAAFQQLKEDSRVNILGPIPYDRLPSFLHAMDALILPRVPSPSSTASNPLKLFEYLAVGKPVIVCGVPLALEIRDLVYAAQSAESLPAATKAALHEYHVPDMNKQSARQSYAKQHTWAQRVQRMKSEIESGYSD